ncbi:phosphodiester glycosidase family protein [Hymenobacter sp. CRA2]|uniref:phosphodiester glycosidase family protein n=1 Tax=Hymenobacter sp. CRA2 TaxID=1955620 RepID=UPI00098F34D3|nr:phosphodiester glycosidase family protein [Hymenobacter sp. CRA2]OON69507.1 hypothetical protein B0919_09545 [Hymenobacter sp. CRA2]
MNRSGRLAVALLAVTLLAGGAFGLWYSNTDAPFVSYRVDPRHQRLQLYWRDEQNRPFRSLGQLKMWLQARGQTLLFATNGGMYHSGNVPVGLFIQGGKTLMPLDTTSGTGNFYLKPNGVFYLTADGRAGVCRTQDFRPRKRVSYATQSGPMLVMDGRIHPALQPGSKNLNVRNGVGLLPDGRVLFAMSKQEINFYDFAEYFRRQGCRNALYLDGFVSRTYAPAQDWAQTDGDFGVIIGVTAK